MPADPRDLDLPLEEEAVEESAEISNEELIAALDEDLARDAEPPREEAVAEPETPEVGDEPVPDEPAAEDADGDGSGEPEASGEEAPAEEAEAEGSPSDEFGELDDKTPQKTRDRFQAVKEKYDELHNERDKVTKEFEEYKAETAEWIGTIQGTGTNADQFGQTLTFLRELNSGDPAQMKSAYGFVTQLQTQLAQKLGITTTEHDPLNDYPELKERVEQGYLERSDAERIVQAEVLQKQLAAHKEKQSAKEAQDSELAQGMNSLKELGETLQQDPAFRFKFPVIKGLIENLPKSGLPPSKWRETVETAYNAIDIPAYSQPTPRVQAPNPLRPGSASPASSAMQKEPGSALEALDQALDRGW